MGFNLSAEKNRQHWLTYGGSCVLLILLTASFLFTPMSDLVGFLLPCILTLSFINLSIYLYTQSAQFGWYAAVTALTCSVLTSFPLHFASDEGLSLEFISVYPLNLIINLALLMAIITAIMHCRSILKIHKTSQVIDLTIKAYLFILLILVGVNLFIAANTAMYLSFIFAGIGLTLLVILNAYAWHKKEKPAKALTIGWAIFSILVLVQLIQNINQSFDVYLSAFLLLSGLLLKAYFVTTSSLTSYIQIQKNLWQTEIKTLTEDKQLLLNQAKKLSEQENETEELEYKVQERTLELEIALRELSEINRELEKKNTLDALTGIKNRSYFDKKYQAEVRRSRREQTQLSIVMLDIDHFKSVNDQYGHLVGDECIKTVAQTIQAALKRPSDYVCRYGGEEFALILPSTELTGALDLIERIRQTIADTPIIIDDVKVQITVSAGVATAIAEQSEDSLLALADKQLYKAKNTGRNKILGSELIHN
ncbi:sensor domain-containing diguanylate cyclase [Paraglaciecola sp.]|uniref:sensor domain-containing diguanylate cyclase n=1 Tax=Paraglaciecola sp. TaxID=1920173 RepID=UPI003EFB05F9